MTARIPGYVTTESNGVALGLQSITNAWANERFDGPIGDVEVDFLRQQATRLGQPLDLTHREMTLLRYLAERAGSVVHRDELLHELWGFPDAVHTRAVDNAVARMRRKIEPDPHHPQFIRTVHGDGYSMAPSALSE